MNIRDLIIQILDDAVVKRHKVQIETTDDAFNMYCDTSGQRGVYLSFYDYKINCDKRPVMHDGTPMWHNLYIPRRKLSFTNEQDKGKENAILGVLRVPKEEELKFISIVSKKDITEITFNSINILIKE